MPTDSPIHHGSADTSTRPAVNADPPPPSPATCPPFPPLPAATPAAATLPGYADFAVVVILAAVAVLGLLLAL